MACARVLSPGGGRLLGPIGRLSGRLRRGMTHLQAIYGWLLERWLRRGGLVIGLLLVGLLVTGSGLAAMPTAFIPNEDQGQIRGYFTLPEGASLERSVAVMDRIRQVVAEEPLVRTGNFYAGNSFGQSGEDRGSFYLRLLPQQQRSGPDQTSEAVKQRLSRAIRRHINDARVVVTTPPTVQGFSSESGIKLELLDRSGGRLGLQEFEAVSQRFIAAAQSSGRFERVSTRFDASSPAGASAWTGINWPPWIWIWLPPCRTSAPRSVAATSMTPMRAVAFAASTFSWTGSSAVSRRI